MIKVFISVHTNAITSWPIADLRARGEAVGVVASNHWLLIVVADVAIAAVASHNQPRVLLLSLGLLLRLRRSFLLLLLMREVGLCGHGRGEVEDKVVVRVEGNIVLYSSYIVYIVYTISVLIYLYSICYIVYTISLEMYEYHTNYINYIMPVDTYRYI